MMLRKIAAQFYRSLGGRYPPKGVSRRIIAEAVPYIAEQIPSLHQASYLRKLTHK
jgi:hypothetical protein